MGAGAASAIGDLRGVPAGAGRLGADQAARNYPGDLGNPPYNGYAGIAKIEEERDLTNAYRAAIAGLPAPQGQGLNDLYIRFFRIAERRIAKNADGQGIVCFISNNAWLDGLSHPTMRHHYLRTFQHLFIDNLNGDRKISEYAPDGQTSNSVYPITESCPGIRIGTAISTLLRRAERRDRIGMVHYRDFEDARASVRRESLLQSLQTHHPPYSELGENARLGFPFKPRAVQDGYLEWPRLPELFPTCFPGVKTSGVIPSLSISTDNVSRQKCASISGWSSVIQICGNSCRLRWKPVHVLIPEIRGTRCK